MVAAAKHAQQVQFDSVCRVSVAIAEVARPTQVHDACRCGKQLTASIGAGGGWPTSVALQDVFVS